MALGMQQREEAVHPAVGLLAAFRREPVVTDPLPFHADRLLERDPVGPVAQFRWRAVHVPHRQRIPLGQVEPLSSG